MGDVELGSDRGLYFVGANRSEIGGELCSIDGNWQEVAAAQPKWVRTEDVPGELVDREKELIAREALASGKPERIVERIVEGRINSFYKDNVLYEQEYIRTDQYEGKVGDMVTELAASMGENIGVRRFARLAVGEQDT